MNGARRLQVDAVFAQALDLPADDRAAFLDAACSADTSLRHEVDRLLRLSLIPAGALEPGAAALDLLRVALEDTDTAGQPQPGTRVGAWRILRELGRGGMGTVYLVERADGRYTQAAALKLVRSASAVGDLQRRFERERRILATLGDADVARILDGGETDAGQSYLVMEYVNGVPIDRYCDDRRLTIPARLALFSRVCRTVEHAHRRLIVHRDLKPSNILVTADGVPRLLDFGIAALLSGGSSGEALTLPLDRILTPEYASPEQVRGESVAVASDVYQLGLLLYELLAGCRAQRVVDHSARALERVVCETSPVAPSAAAAAATPEVPVARQLTRAALVRILRGDLDTIVLCALRKEPERRYASVGALLDDLERFRQQRPLLARTDSLTYRTWKFARRHRPALTAAAVLAASLSVALPVVLRQQLEATKQHARAEQVEQVLRQLLLWPSPGDPARPRDVHGFLDEAVRLIDGQFETQPGSQANLLTTAAEVYVLVGRYDSAAAALTRAYELRVRESGPDSVEAGDALARVAQAQHYAGHLGEAESSLRRAITILERQSAPNRGQALRLRVDLGDLLHSRGALAEAEKVLRQAVAGLEAQPPETYTLARAVRDLANVMRDQGRLDDALAGYHTALGIFRSVTADPEPQVTITQIDLARLLTMRGDHEEAAALLVAGLAKLRAHYAGDHALTGMALRELGYVRLEQGRFDESYAALDEGERVLAGLLGSEHPVAARLRAHQAALALKGGDLEEATRLAQLTLQQLEKAGLAQHPSAIEARRILGEALMASGDVAAARDIIGVALNDATRQFVAGDPRVERLEALSAR